MYKSRKTGILGVIITVIILILLVVFTNINVNELSSVENIFSKIVMPIQNGLTHLKNRIQGNSAFFEDIDKLKNENEELTNKNRELEQQLRELEIIKSENTMLRQYNNMSEKYSEYNTVPAYIINRDISNLSNTMVINVGSNDGVDINMPVITTEGVVGHVISVTSTTSKVKPIIDSSSSTSAIISTSRESVVLKGILRKQQ